MSSHFLPPLTASFWKTFPPGSCKVRGHLFAGLGSEHPADSLPACQVEPPCPLIKLNTIHLGELSVPERALKTILQ